MERAIRVTTPASVLAAARRSRPTLPAERCARRRPATGRVAEPPGSSMPETTPSIRPSMWSRNATMGASLPPSNASRNASVSVSGSDAAQLVRPRHALLDERRRFDGAVRVHGARRRSDPCPLIAELRAGRRRSSRSGTGIAWTCRPPRLPLLRYQVQSSRTRATRCTGPIPTRSNRR